MFVAGVLIPVKYLLNGSTITQVPRGSVTYYHVELSVHDVLLAEGLPAESYLDTGDRSAFANGGGSVALHPRFSAWQWDAAGCAPLVVAGAQVLAVRRQMAANEVALIEMAGHRVLGRNLLDHRHLLGATRHGARAARVKAASRRRGERTRNFA